MIIGRITSQSRAPEPFGKVLGGKPGLEVPIERMVHACRCGGRRQDLSTRLEALNGWDSGRHAIFQSDIATRFSSRRQYFRRDDAFLRPEFVAPCFAELRDDLVRADVRNGGHLR